MLNNPTVVKEKGVKEKRLFLFKEKKETDTEIIDTLYKLKSEMDFVHKNLDYTTDDVLIDSYIYEMKALNKKYEYYLKLCKEKGLSAKGFNKIS